MRSRNGRGGRGGWMLAIATCVLVAAPAVAWDDDEDEIEYDEAHVFFELNDTDGDLGIHGLIDGEAWKYLEIEDPRGRSMLHVFVTGRLKRQGLTEIFFESAEPTFDELDPEVFFQRFPAGTYEIEGRTLDWQELEAEVELTHVIPAPPEDVLINGEPYRPEDGSDCEEDELPELTPPVVVEWSPVTEHHPELGEEGDVEISRYQVVAEQEDEDENVFASSTDVAPDDRVGPYAVMIPSEFFADGAEVKFEVLAREESFNQTAVESCPFEVVLP